jgi:hypothetical protein
LPYKKCHGCLIDENATEVVGYKEAQTKWGKIRLVMARNAAGKIVVRNMEIPSTVPVHVAQHLCNLRNGKFSPVTAIDPKKQVLSEADRLDFYLSYLGLEETENATPNS